MNYPHPILAREGWPYIAASIVAAIAVWVLFGFAWSLPLWLIVIFVVQFFRDPPRQIPAQPNAVLSAADGRVLCIRKIVDPYTQKDSLLISVFMNVFNAHSNRSPVDGVIERVQYHAGTFVNADLDKASSENERNALVVKLPNGVLMSVVQVAGLIARRIVCHVKAGETLTRGQRYGFIRFGSRVDIYLPLSAKPRVAVGDKVYATSTIIAEL